jgi:hypothetical protein
VPYKNRKKEYAKRKQDRMLTKLAEFEEFTTSILPKLRAMLKEGAQADDILEFSKAAAAARIVTIAATERDSTKALAAAKDVLDRTQGKAVERIQQTHKFERLEEEQLDALLLSKLKEAEVIDVDGEGGDGAP